MNFSGIISEKDLQKSGGQMKLNSYQRKLLSIGFFIASTIIIFLTSISQVKNHKNNSKPDFNQAQANTNRYKGKIHNSEPSKKLNSTNSSPLTNDLLNDSTTTSDAPSAYSFFDIEGREISIRHRNIDSISDLLESKNSFNPMNEFDSLAETDFTKNESLPFSGLFIDQKNQFKLAIVIDPMTKKLDPESCIETPATQNTQAPIQTKSLELRDDQSGYSILKIDNDRMLKMGYSFSQNRILLGKLYKRTAMGWQLDSELRFTELDQEKDNEIKICGIGFRG